jgi:hypothetical protein
MFWCPDLVVVLPLVYVLIVSTAAIIRVIKIFRVAKETFRMRSRMYEIVIGCVCGLVRLRVQSA